jgi:hypothetical protein
MGKIKGWKKSLRTNKRYKQWNSIKGNVVTVEIPPSGWRTYISTEKGEKYIKSPNQKTAIEIAIKYMRSHPNG